MAQGFFADSMGEWGRGRRGEAWSGCAASEVPSNAKFGDQRRRSGRLLTRAPDPYRKGEWNWTGHAGLFVTRPNSAMLPSTLRHANANRSCPCLATVPNPQDEKIAVVAQT